MTSPAITGNPLESSVSPWRSIPAWLRNPVGAVLIIALFFCLLGTATLMAEIGRPFGGYLTYGYVGRDEILLVYETPQWWPGISSGQLQYGDELTDINGKPYSTNVWAEMSSSYESGEKVNLRVERVEENRPIVVSVPVTLFSIQDFLDVKLPELLVGFVFWLLAIIVLRARPDSTTNRVFALLAACVAIHRLTAVSSLVTDDLLLVNLPKVGHMIAAGLIGPLLIHLAVLFPRSLNLRSNVPLGAFYTLGLMSGITLAFTRLPFWARVPDGLDWTIDSIAYQTMLYLLLGGVIALFARLIWSWGHRQHETRRDRRVVRIVMLGMLFSMPAVIVVLAPIIPSYGIVRSTFWQGLDLRYLMLAIPIAFALAIVRYQTFQSPSPLFIFVIVLSLSGLLAAIGVSIWRMTQLDSFSSQRPPFQVLFGFIFLASFFWSRQADWRGWFGRFLYRADRNYESALSFAGRVMGKNDLRVLPATMAKALVDELDLERAAVWLWQPGTSTYDLAAAAGAAEPSPPLVLIPPGAPLNGRPLPVARPSTPKWLQESAIFGTFEVLVPLSAGGEPIGLLGLGRRWDEEFFDERDLAIAELVGQQAALFVLAATQVEELRHVPERVAEAQERERYRLAGELHDTIQQFLGRLPFFLTVSRNMMDSDQTEAAALLDRCMTDVEDAAGVLREIRANLAPNQLVTSLRIPLGSLAVHVKRQVGLEVQLCLPEGLDEATTIGTRHALYRVIQQALDNTAAHAEATEVKVTLARENGRVVFSVADNGDGSTPEERSTAQARGSFGLQSMRARIETVGGEFGFTSETGQGTTVSGWVPAA